MQPFPSKTHFTIMESNTFNQIKLCSSLLISLCYCYWIPSFIPSGKTRLIFLLPIIIINLLIPLTFSSVHMTGTIGFFCAWLANFKLLLFAFNKGPLSSYQSISLPHFIALACLPIKIQQKLQKKVQKNGKKTNKKILDPSNGSKSLDFETNPISKTTKTSTPFSHYVIKILLLVAIVKFYDYRDHIHPKIILLMYCFHIYFMLEVILAIVAALARKTLGVELEPQFNDPLLSTSLQDFWGRRWNLMVTSIMRPTVYEPTVRFARSVVGHKWAPLIGVFGTFVVSGLMHELILFYIGRLEPTFRMTCFFLLHGVCLVVEIGLKKSFVTGGWRLPRWVSGPLTAGFVFLTSFWLFLPEFIRCRVDVRSQEEYVVLANKWVLLLKWGALHMILSVISYVVLLYRV